MSENNNQVANSVYSDFTDVGFNLYNFTLYFGIMEDGKSQLLGKVKMSPETAKQFLNMLKTNLESYEKVYGKINEFTPEVAEKERKMIEEIKKFSEQKEAKKEPTADK
jgi:hypothetical protein